MHLIVDACQLIAALFIAPILLLRSWKTGKYRTDWDQRRGHMPDLRPTDPDHPRIWIHAVSVGEMNAVRGLIAQWREQRPQTEFVISCTTDTGKARARELFPDLLIVRYPLDFSRFVTRAFDRLKPTLIVLVELEIWFNFVTLARKRGIPVAIVNGRLSEKSARWFARIPPIAKRMFGALAWVGAQDETYAERFCRLGVPPDRVIVTGSLKWETAQIADTIPGALELARAIGIIVRPDQPGRAPPYQGGVGGGREGDNARVASESGAQSPPIWVCGSTGPGEEDIILDAVDFLRDPSEGGNLAIQVCIVPRKPERFDEVAELIERRGFTCVRRSQSPDGTTRPYDANTIQIVDTMGELRKVYSLADVVFVGRSLVPMGGSDMMEVAALEKPILVGPYTGNFRDAMEQLRRAGAIQELRAADGQRFGSIEIGACVMNLLSISAEAQKMARSAREVVQKNLGATQRTLDRLFMLVPNQKSA